MKRNTIIATLLFLLLAAAGTVKAQQLVDGWKKIYTGAEGNLYDICCLDADNIWVCAQNGGLLKSSDGGETWVRKHTEEGYAMRAITFWDAQVGYALGYGEPNNGVLLKTTDAGENWMRVADEALSQSITDSPYLELFLVGVDALYIYQNLYYTCTPGLLKSTDGGLSFEWVDLPFESTLEMVDGEAKAACFEGNEGYCIFSRGNPDADPMLGAFHTGDGGQTWTRHVLLAEDGDYYSDPFSMVKTHALGQSDARLFYYRGYFDTHDGFVTPPSEVHTVYEDGMMGSNSFIGDKYYPSDMKFTNNLCGCHVSNVPWMATATVEGGACVTKDGGETWEPLQRGLDPHRQVFSVDGVDTTFYVTSENGVVYKRSLIELAAVDEVSLAAMTVSPTLTEGEVTLSGVKLREVTVYNTLGQLVLTKKEDADTMTLDLTGQPSGCYFISVTDQNGQRCVKKIVKQ